MPHLVIREILDPAAVLPALKATSKKQVLQELSQRVSDLTGIEKRAVFDTLLARERLGSTAVGEGVAIPHGRLEDLPAMTAVFARLDRPVDFDALDDEPVDLVFLLLVRECAGAEHLKALAKVARVLRDRAIREKLRGTDSADGLYALLIDSESDAEQAA